MNGRECSTPPRETAKRQESGRLTARDVEGSGVPLCQRSQQIDTPFRGGVPGRFDPLPFLVTSVSKVKVLTLLGLFDNPCLVIPRVAFEA